MGIFSKNNKEEDLNLLLRNFKSEFRIFLVANNIPRQELEITSIDLKPREEEDYYDVVIHLCNLGRLIGKNGEVIKRLSICVSSSLNKKIFINAIESDLWK